MPSEITPAPVVVRAPTLRSEHIARPAMLRNISRTAENRPIRIKTHTHLPDRIFSARDQLTVWIAEQRKQNTKKSEFKEPVKTPSKSKQTREKSPFSMLNPRNRLATIAGFTSID